MNFLLWRAGFEKTRVHLPQKQHQPSLQGLQGLKVLQGLQGLLQQLLPHHHHCHLRQLQQG